MLNPQGAHQGFTLIELAIGMVIVAILLAFAAPDFSKWIQGSQIRNAAEAMQNGLQLARAEAVRRNAAVQFVIGTGSSWSIGCVTPVADLDGDGKADCPAIIQSRPSAEGSANAAVAADQATIAFNGLGRVTPLPAGDININITNPTGGACAPTGPMRCLRITVSTGGQIHMCDPALTLSATFPQGC